MPMLSRSRSHCGGWTRCSMSCLRRDRHRHRRRNRSERTLYRGANGGHPEAWSYGFGRLGRPQVLLRPDRLLGIPRQRTRAGSITMRALNALLQRKSASARTEGEPRARQAIVESMGRYLGISPASRRCCARSTGAVPTKIEPVSRASAHQAGLSCRSRRYQANLSCVSCVDTDPDDVAGPNG